MTTKEKFAAIAKYAAQLNMTENDGTGAAVLIIGAIVTPGPRPDVQYMASVHGQRMGIMEAGMRASEKLIEVMTTVAGGESEEDLLKKVRAGAEAHWGIIGQRPT